MSPHFSLKFEPEFKSYNAFKLQSIADQHLNVTVLVIVSPISKCCFDFRSLLAEHRQNLLEQLKQENEPAMGLHLAVVILFQHHTGCMIHIPGKCVPHITTFLTEYMSPDDHVKLTQYQGLVVKQLTKGGEVADDSGKSIEILLEEGLNEIKDIASINKKTACTIQNGERTKIEKS